MDDKKITTWVVQMMDEAWAAGFEYGFKAEFQEFVEQAAGIAKGQGREVSPKEIEQIKQDFIRGFFESLEEHKIPVKK